MKNCGLEMATTVSSLFSMFSILCLSLLLFSLLVAESVIRDMVGPDWKQRWFNWKNRTPDQVRVQGVKIHGCKCTGFKRHHRDFQVDGL